MDQAVTTMLTHMMCVSVLKNCLNMDPAASSEVVPFLFSAESAAFGESLSAFLLQTSASCSRRLMKVVRLNDSSKFPNRKLPHNNLLGLKISTAAAPPVEVSNPTSCQNQNSCMKHPLFSFLVPPIFIPPSPLFILVHLSFHPPSSVSQCPVTHPTHTMHTMKVSDE